MWWYLISVRRVYLSLTSHAFTTLAIAIAVTVSAPAAQTQKPKINDSFAKTALAATLAIESDATVPKVQRGQILLAGTIDDKIADADAEATSSEEVSLAEYLHLVYLAKLTYNLKRSQSPLATRVVALKDGEVACLSALKANLRARSSAARPVQCVSFVKLALGRGR